MTKAEEQTGVHKVMRKATAHDTVARWQAVNTIVNSVLIAVLFVLVLRLMAPGSDNGEGPTTLQQIPAFIDEIGARVPTITMIIVSLASAAGMAAAAFRRRQHNERSTDR